MISDVAVPAPSQRRWVKPAAPLPVVEPDRPHAIRAALAMLEEGDTLLLAGKGHETYQEVNGVQYPMDEREIIAAARP